MSNNLQSDLKNTIGDLAIIWANTEQHIVAIANNAAKIRELIMRTGALVNHNNTQPTEGFPVESHQHDHSHEHEDHAHAHSVDQNTMQMVQELKQLRDSWVARGFDLPQQLAEAVEQPVTESAPSQVPTPVAEPNPMTVMVEKIVHTLDGLMSPDHYARGRGFAKPNELGFKLYREDVLKQGALAIVKWPSGFYTDAEDGTMQFLLQMPSWYLIYGNRGIYVVLKEAISDELSNIVGVRSEVSMVPINGLNLLLGQLQSTIRSIATQQ